MWLVCCALVISFFLQCLEGSRENVNQIYRKIVKDSRHQDLVLLDYTEIESRTFASWSMGYVPSSSLTQPINRRFPGTDYFEPYDMSGESAFRLMANLEQTMPTA